MTPIAPSLRRGGCGRRSIGPNVMIKVPGTPEGAPAITTLISEGINVNVTLLFSIEAYIIAANAYLDGISNYVRRRQRIA